MLQGMDVFTFLLAFIVFYFSLSLLTKLRRKENFREKLNDLMKYKERIIQEELTEENEKKIYKSVNSQTFPWLNKFIDRIQRMGTEEEEHVKQSFIKAGFNSEHALLIYGLMKFGAVFSVLVILILVVHYVTDLNNLLEAAIVIFSGLVASYSVDRILNYFVKKRQERIRKAFPEALDLMVICTEAGLSLTATVQRVAREISQVAPDLGYELALLSIELNVFTDRNKALQNFSDRLDSPYFKAVISNIIQAEQYGTPIAQTMRVVSEQFRKDRLVEAEERAARLPVLLTLPMMTLIFPCLYIVIMGPAIIKVLDILPRHHITRK